MMDKLAAMDNVHFIVSKPTPQKKQALWYRGTAKDAHTHFRIDIRAPAMVGLRNLMPNHIKEIDGILVIPFVLALMHTLDVWDYECLRTDENKEVQNKDDCRDQRCANDLQRMMKSSHVLSSRNKLSWTGNTFLDDGHREDMRQRIHRFCNKYPSFAEDWRLLGFELNPTVP